MTPPTPIRAVGYVRGSTDDQINTLDAQRDQIKAYCAFKCVELAETFIDQGESAVAVDFIERPVAARMLSRLSELRANAIIITKLDRGFRGATDVLLTIDLLSKRGVGLHLLDIGLDPTTPVGEMIATVMAAIARFECRRRSERQKEAFATMKKQRQRCGAVPYGWVPVDAGRLSKTGRAAENLVPEPFEQLILARILSGDLSKTAGITCNEAARRLNAAGLKTKNAGQIMRRIATNRNPAREWVCDGKWQGATIECLRRTGRLALSP